MFDGGNRVLQVIQPLPTGTPSVATKDDGVGSTTTGTWSTVSRTGAYGGNVFNNSTTGASVSHTFTGLTAGKTYEVLVRWVPSATPDEYDTNALFEVFGDTSGDPLNSLRVDLNAKTEGLADGSGFLWLSLGAFSPYTGTLTVKLSDDDTSGKLVIDTMRLVETGPVTNYEFDDPGNLTAVTDALGHVTNYMFDELNRLEQIIQPDPNGAGTGDPSPVTTYTYNDVGWITSVTDPENRVTAYRYDEMGRQIATIREGDEQGLLGQYFIPGVSVTTFPDFDSLNPEHSRIDSQVNVATTAGDFGGYTDLDSDFAVRWTGAININTAGEVGFQLESNDRSRLYIDGQLVVNIDSTSASTQTDYDTIELEAGWHLVRLEYFEHDGNNGMVFKYDPVDGALQVVPSNILRPVEQYVYDTVGRQVGMIDRLGHTTTSTYDDLDRLLSSTNPNGETTSYVYNNANHQWSLTDPEGYTTTFVYDALYRTVEETNTLNGTHWYKYDAVGNLTRKIDRNGRITRYEYDHLHRQTEEIWQEETVGDKVKSRYVFYDNYQGLDPDDAIALGAGGAPKEAVLPGESDVASVRGFINGLIIDIVDVGSISASDFEFKTSPTDDPTNWSTYSPSISINVRQGQGKDGSDRI